MSDKRKVLLRPVPLEGITFDAVGQPRVRDTGVLVADVVFDLGPDHLTDEDILKRHPELDITDIDIVRRYADTKATPIEFEVLIHRVVGRDPTPDDVLTAYLFLPRIVLRPEGRDRLGAPTKVRSSFEAAFADAANARGMWLAAICDLVLLDQIGTALVRTDHCDVRRSWTVSSVERALERFSDLPERERAALYALRCALAHDFSLVNIPPDFVKDDRRLQLQHSFLLHDEGHQSLVEFPDAPWDGDPLAVTETPVDLALLAELTTDVRTRIYECFDSGTLELALGAEESRRRYIFTHGAPVEEWEEQLHPDDAGRWGPR